MIVIPVGHLRGDPQQLCGKLTLEAANWHEAAKLAQLFRVLADPEQRAELVEAAGYIEMQFEAANAPFLT